MDTRFFSAYNLARGVLLNSKLTVADSGNQPLKLLEIVVGGMGMDPSAGLWLTPLHTIPAVPRVFPFDLIYLDKEYRVLETAEMGPGIDFPPFFAEVASALILPSDTLRHTQTGSDDCLIVCISNELASLLAASSALTPESSIPRNLKPDADIGGASRDSVIELIPTNRTSAASVAPVTTFDESVLTAVAKVAERRNPQNSSPSGRDRIADPSKAVEDAVLDSSSRVQPAIIEHHIDPEDLFSNWVVSGPPVLPTASRTGRNAPPVLPESPKLESADQAPRPDSPDRKSRRTSESARKQAEGTGSVRAPEKRSATPSAQVETLGQPDSSEKAVGAKGKAGPVAKTRTQPNSGSAPPRTASTTTFTTVPFGMWQVSMPTGVAPMAGAKSPEPIKQPAPNKNKDVDRIRSVASTSSKPQPSPPAPSEPVSSALPGPRRDPSQLKSESRVESDSVDRDPTPKPLIKSQTKPEVHTPGDFVASLQEKLERAQQSKPATATNKAGEMNLASAAGSPAPVHPPERTGPASTPIKTSGVVAARPEPAKREVEPVLATRPRLSTPANQGKAEPPLSSLRSKFKQWLNPSSSPSDRRRTTRRYVPGMVAHYFTGGAPKPHNIADISMSGMYLLTDDRWMPGTMIQMTLQKPCSQGEKKQSINVLSRIVRRGSDGIAAEFVMSEAVSRISHDIQPSQATDKMALARFL